jgi:hypothetical protein
VACAVIGSKKKWELHTNPRIWVTEHKRMSTIYVGT